MRKLLAVVTGTALLMAGCNQPASQAPVAQEEPQTITVVVDPQAECQPKGVPGNCWLPLLKIPMISSQALNSSAACNNSSRDQTSCWPQPGTELTAVCIRRGADGRPWYGFVLQPAQVTNKAAVAGGATDKPSYGYAAANHLTIAEGDEPGDLAKCP